jgi:hypothetical protein
MQVSRDVYQSGIPPAKGSFTKKYSISLAFNEKPASMGVSNPLGIVKMNEVNEIQKRSVVHFCFLHHLIILLLITHYYLTYLSDLPPS